MSVPTTNLNTVREENTVSTYNGYRNRGTWNVALWLQSELLRGDLEHYAWLKPEHPTLQQFAKTFGLSITPDGIPYVHPSHDLKRLDEIVRESLADFGWQVAND